MDTGTERQERQRFIRRVCLYGVLLCLAGLDFALWRDSADAGLWMGSVCLLVSLLANGF